MLRPKYKPSRKLLSNGTLEPYIEAAKVRLLTEFTKEIKRLTFAQFDKQEDELRQKGWKVREVKEDYKIVLMERT